MASTLTRALEAASCALNAQDQRNDRVDPFIGTTWLVAEMEEAITKCAALVFDLKTAKANRKQADVERTIVDLAKVNFQMGQMIGWTAEAFGTAMERQNAD